MLTINSHAVYGNRVRINLVFNSLYFRVQCEQTIGDSDAQSPILASEVFCARESFGEKAREAFP